MKKLNCNVVRDILPLYADEVVCEDTRALVDEHLAECEACRKELGGMCEKVVIPMQADVDGSLRKVKNRWGKKQLFKGIGITAVLLMMLFVGFLYFYNHGFPAKYEDIEMLAGLECMNVSKEQYQDYGWEEEYAQWTGREQQWFIHWAAEDGVQLFVEEESVWEENDAGELIKSQIIYRIKTFPFVISGDLSNNACPTGTTPFRSWDEIPVSGDCTVTVIFADKEITYSMKEEGLWDLDTEHDPAVCWYCGEK